MFKIINNIIYKMINYMYKNNNSNMNNMLI